MDHIKDVVSGLIEGIEGKQKKDGSLHIINAWGTIVGETIGKHTKPVHIKKKVLYVVVDQATWVYELNQKYKKELLRLLNKEVGEDCISDMCFRVGDIH